MNGDECNFDDSSILVAIGRLQRTLDDIDTRIKRIEDDVRRIKSDVRSSR